MVTTRKGNKKTARSCDSTITTLADEGENNDPKRQRTNVMLLNLPRALFAEGLNVDSEEHQHEQAAAQDLAASAIDEVVAVNNDISNDNELPTTDQLSQEFCKIVDVVHYSRDESLRALENLSNWASTEDTDFLKSFHTYGGILRVLDFLNATMNDVNCKGAIRMKCIKKAADLIRRVAYPGENDNNKDIAKKIATTLLNCDGIDTLVNASEEYTGGDDIPQLKAMCSVWCAIRNTTYNVTVDSLMSQEQAIVIFDTGIDVISQLKSVCGRIASKTLEHVFYTFYIMLNDNYVTKKYFQDKNILSKCLEVFKKNGEWNFRSSEGLIQEAVDFFDTCHIKHLLDESSDYEMILPLLVVVLKKYPSNDNIRKYALKMMNHSCSTINDKKIILRSGVMESLGVLLASDEINDDEDEKKKVRTLITKIIA